MIIINCITEKDYDSHLWYGLWSLTTLVFQQLHTRIINVVTTEKFTFLEALMVISRSA